MKATGIVRRIDARVIITPRVINPYKHWVFGDFRKAKDHILNMCQKSIDLSS